MELSLIRRKLKEMRRFIIVLALLCAVVLPVHAEAFTPMVEFIHKYNSNYDCSMKLSKVKNLAKWLPNNLRMEIRDQYYPEIRRGLMTADNMTFLKAEVTKETVTDDVFTVTLSFPKFNLILRNVTWEDLDRIFYQYIAPRNARQDTQGLPPESILSRPAD